MAEHVATSHNIHYVNKYLSHAHVLLKGLECFVFFALHLSHRLCYISILYYYSSTIIVTTMTIALVLKNKVFLVWHRVYKLAFGRPWDEI